MTDPQSQQTRWRRLVAMGLLSVLIGLSLMGISASVTARLVFSIGSEQIVVQPISAFEFPSLDASFTAPPVGEKTPLSAWLADQIERMLHLVFAVMQAIGGLLVVIGTVTLVITIGLVEK